jgi:hypothetical protein
MADIFTASNVYQGTASPGAVQSTEIHQVCANANINASNQLEATFWILRNGVRVDSNLGQASYRLRDKAGNVVSGVSQTGINPDVNGYFHIAAVSAALIYDLTHYVLEIEIPIDGVEYASAIGMVNGE